MKNLKHLFLIVLTALSFPKQSFALSCDRSYGEELIKKYDYIIQAMLTPSTKNKFKVLKSYKGTLNEGDTFYLQYNNSGLMQQYSQREFSQTENYVLFIQYDEGKKSFISNPCTPIFSIQNVNTYHRNLWAQAKTLYQLEMLGADTYEEKRATLEELTYKLPDVYDYSYRLGFLLEENGIFEEALEVYKLAMAKRYVSHLKDKGRYDEAKYNSQDEVFFENPMMINGEHIRFRTAGIWHPLLGYGRTLKKMGRLEEAKIILKNVISMAKSEEAVKLYEELAGIDD